MIHLKFCAKLLHRDFLFGASHLYRDQAIKAISWLTIDGHYEWKLRIVAALAQTLAAMMIWL